MRTFWHGRNHGAVLEMLQQIIYGERSHSRPSFDRGAAHMRQKYSIGQIAQRLRHRRFSIKDIEPCPAELAVLKCLNQSGLIDDRSAADIDQRAIWPQCLQDLGINDFMGGGAAGCNAD